MSFVFEQHFSLNARKNLGTPAVWKVVDLAKKSLAEKDVLASCRSVILSTTSDLILHGDNYSESKQRLDHDRFLQELLCTPGMDNHQELLYIFVAHCVLLKQIPLTVRAQPLPALHPELMTILRDDFLPNIFTRVEQLSALHGQFIDIDGRIFLSLLKFIINNTPNTFEDVLGQDVFNCLERIQHNKKTSALRIHWLKEKYPLSAIIPQNTASTHSAPLVGLLPFTHPVLDQALSSIQVWTSLDASPEDVPRQQDYMHFGRDSLFIDTKHWHNHKRAILPKYLGGDNDRPLDDLARKKKLKREQFFMANLGEHAQTLTGALGTPLERINIVTSNSKATKTLPALTNVKVRHALWLSRECNLIQSPPARTPLFKAKARGKSPKNPFSQVQTSFVQRFPRKSKRKHQRTTIRSESGG